MSASSLSLILLVTPLASCCLLIGDRKPFDGFGFAVSPRADFM